MSSSALPTSLDGRSTKFADYSFNDRDEITRRILHSTVAADSISASLRSPRNTGPVKITARSFAEKHLTRA